IRNAIAVPANSGSVECRRPVPAAVSKNTARPFAFAVERLGAGLSVGRTELGGTAAEDQPAGAVEREWKIVFAIAGIWKLPVGYQHALAGGVSQLRGPK